MKFSTSAAILALASVVAAAPGYGPTPHGGSVSAEQFVNSCGRNNIECCNKEVSRKEVNPTTNGGLLNALNGIGLDSLSVFDQCSKLDIPSMICLDATQLGAKSITAAFANIYPP